MAGFEKTMFVSLPEGMDEELKCTICLNIFNAPMTVPCCQTSYCRKCIEDCLKKPASGRPTYPSCRKSLTGANLLPQPVWANNYLNKLQVYCDNSINGCTQIVKLGELSQHLTRCPFSAKSPTLKFSQLFKNINQSVDRLQITIKKEDYINLKKELDVLQKEVVKISSIDDSNKDRQMLLNSSTGAHSQPHNNIVSEKSLIESARYQLHRPVIAENNITSPGLVKMIKIKCIGALIYNDTFKLISDYLADNLSNDEYNWLALVHSTHSSVQLSVNQDIVYYITITFGELSIKLLGFLSDDDPEGSDSSDEWQTVEVDSSDD